MERVDARGKTCPLPVIETKKVLESMTEGTVEVLVDNACLLYTSCRQLICSHKGISPDK